MTRGKLDTFIETKTNKDGDYEINLSDNIDNLFGSLKKERYRTSLRELKKYFKSDNNLVVRGFDNNGNECYELYTLNNINIAKEMLYNDFGGIFRGLEENELDKFVFKLYKLDIHDFCLFSKDNIKLSKNNPKRYIKVYTDFNVVNHNMKTLTEDFLNLQGYDYSFLMDLLNVIFNYEYIKKALYFNGVKEAFKSSFVDLILANCVGYGQYHYWEGGMNSNFPYEGFREHQLLVSADDLKRIDAQAMKRSLSRFHNVNEKYKSEYTILNYKTFIFSRNKIEDKIYEILDNRLIVLEFRKNVRLTDPELFDKLLEVWGKDDQALCREIEQILYDYVNYSKDVSVEDSIINLEALESVSLEKSIYDIAEYIMVNVGCKDDKIEEFKSCNIDLRDEDFVKWNYNEFINVLEDVKFRIPSEVNGEISKISPQKGMRQINENISGSDFGEFGSKNKYRNCYYINNVDKLMEMINNNC